jgi:hypothetical protein
MQSTMSYVGEQAQSAAGDIPNCVLANNDEIKKQTSILIRLVKLLKDGEISPESFSNIALRYGKRLQGSLDLWVIYQSIVNEESKIYRVELESAMEGNSALSARHAIGDVSEEEYKLKQAMYDWDIQNINKKSRLFESSLSQLQSIRDGLGIDDTEEMRLLMDDDCRAIRELGLDSRVSELLLGNFSALARIIE